MKEYMKHFLILIGAAALVAIVAGCATSPAKRTEKLLTQSGFKAVPATTAAQQQQMNSLPAAKVSPVKHKGQRYYVYPDPARNVLYVGNKAQFQAYQIAVQDAYLAQDAKLVRDASAAPVQNEDALEMSGAMPSLEELWQGWPE
jgi:hypothetical protein